MIEKFKETIASKIVEGETLKIGIVTHANPDPDAIGSALGIQYILSKVFADIETIVIYKGEVSHPQNKTMVNVLNVPLIHDSEVFVEGCDIDYFICVDVCTERALPKEYYEKCIAVIDHHKVDTVHTEFKDIRQVGACASIVCSYISDLGLELDASSEDDEFVATALLLGIKTDTKDFVSDNVAEVDLKAHAFLQPVANTKKIASIVNYALPPYYFDLRKNLDIESNYWVVNGVYIGYLGYISVSKRDIIASLAEERARVEGVDTAFIFAIVGSNIEVSVRSSGLSIDVNALCQEIFGKEYGGGKTGAGAARIPMNYLSISDVPDDLQQKMSGAVRDFVMHKISAQIAEHR